MQTEYVTEKNQRLLLGKIDRRLIDRLKIEREPPRPPTRIVEVWGGIEEEIPVLDDPGYQSRRTQYLLWLAKGQDEAIAGAITISDEGRIDWTELTELADLGLVMPSPAVGFLTYLLSDHDRANVIDIVLYQSTVTARGIMEAENAYAVNWMSNPISAWRVPGTPAEFSWEFEARRVARAYGYNWPEFCKLTGPEQSAEVAHFRLTSKLTWLEANYERTKHKRA